MTDKLSSSLVSAIKKRPTHTILRDFSKKTQDRYNQLKVIQPAKHSYILPEKFDGRIVWKGMLAPVLDQGSCGACWAIATVNTLSSKFNIQTEGEYNILLSPTKMIFCYFDQKFFDIIFEGELEETKAIDKLTTIKTGCIGNTLLDAWEYLYVRGTVTQKCVPYVSSLKNYDLTDSDVTEIAEGVSCTSITGIYGDNCVNGLPARFYRTANIYYIAGTLKYSGSEENIRSKIYEWGPVSTGMRIYPDFYTFDAKNEIYKWNGKGPLISGHAIMLVGWGVENGVKYWIAQNSWGKDWGDKGYFKILRGVNEVKIEENVISGSPDFSYDLDKKLLPGYKFAQDKLAFKNRQKLKNKKLKLGQSEISGYSYRHINLGHVKDTRLFPEKYLKKNWGKFIAGELGQKNINYIFITIIIVFTILLLFLLVYILILCKKCKKL